MITIKIPAPSSMVVANLLGLLGLIATVLAIGGLAGVWWAVLSGGVALVGLSVIAATHAEAAQAAEVQPAARPVAVAKSA